MDLMSRAAKWWLAAALSAGLHGLGVAALACLKVARHEGHVAPPCEIAYVSIEPVREPPLKSTMRSPIVEISLTAAEASEPPATPATPDVPGPRATPASNASAAHLGNPQSAAPHGSAGVGRSAASFFGVPGKGKSIVYLIDCSSSMGPSGALETARHELLASLGTLPEGVRFQIIVFHSQSRTLLGRDGWLSPDSATFERVTSALRDLQAEGKTDYDQALKRALSFRPDVLYFLTDARDLPSRLILDTTRLNAGRSIIHVIELAAQAPRADSDLQALARHNGGDFRQCRP